jgi:GNAT superfamily N-acetyltransferase
MDVKHINLTQDKPHLAAIWRSCFPEDGAFADVFLNQPDTRFIGLAVYREEVPVSMAFVLPCDLHIQNETVRAGYVYGVATLPEYQNKGYAAAILKAARNTPGIDLLFLHPATPQLGPFYQKHGYRDYMYADTVCMTDSVQKNILNVEWIPFDATRYTLVRNALQNAPATCWAEFDAPLLQTLLSHGFLAFAGCGMALVIPGETKVFVPEMVGNASEKQAILAGIQSKSPDNPIVLTVPGTKQRVGMVIPLTDAAESLLKNVEMAEFSGPLFDV